jgi:hypothetical protein
MGQAENPTMYAVEQVCGLYGVQVTREQSRSITVQSGGRWRPMFFGQWTDEFGKRRFGKADFLARPRVLLVLAGGGEFHMSVPLWIECKSLEGKTNSKTKLDQAAFEKWVTKNGDYYMRVQQDVRPLVAWFDAHGVEKRCDDIALASVVTPLDSTQLYLLPCKYCGFARAQHTGPAFGCPLHLAQCNTKLIGKVWSPDLRKGVKAKCSDQEL